MPPPALPLCHASRYRRATRSGRDVQNNDRRPVQSNRWRNNSNTTADSPFAAKLDSDDWHFKTKMMCYLKSKESDPIKAKSLMIKMVMMRIFFSLSLRSTWDLCCRWLDNDLLWLLVLMGGVIVTSSNMCMWGEGGVFKVTAVYSFDSGRVHSWMWGWHWRWAVIGVWVLSITQQLWTHWLINFSPAHNLTAFLTFVISSNINIAFRTFWFCCGNCFLFNTVKAAQLAAEPHQLPVPTQIPLAA